MYKTYVAFKLPGAFVSEQEVRCVFDRSFPTDIPANCFGFYFYDIFQTEGPNGEVLTSSPQNVSEMTYFGEEYTLDRVKQEFPDMKILISNIECNGWDRVVRTRLGNWQALDPMDRVLDGVHNW